MFKNQEGLVFVGVESKMSNKMKPFNLISFANPSTYEKFEVFLPETINPYEKGLKNGDLVSVSLNIYKEGFNFKIDLLSMTAFNSSKVS